MRVRGPPDVETRRRVLAILWLMDSYSVVEVTMLVEYRVAQSAPDPEPQRPQKSRKTGHYLRYR
ncbi:MAG: hypothetical protein CMQ61_07860 [Gammaproteobacteria bacterium]|nr:hypothetical protein [Gammaproteobacteria bacterium]